MLRKMLCALVWSCTLQATFYSPEGIEVINNSPTAQLIVDKVKQYLPDAPIILEAGAFDGCDTIHLGKLLPQAKLYTFEPVPELFQKASVNVSPYPNIQIYNYALSDKNGFATMHLSEESKEPGIVTQSSSLLTPKDHLILAPDIVFNKAVEVPTITIDDWAQQHNISHVDFLKLDMQGYELNTMKGSPKILSTIRVVMTEVEFVEAYEHQYLYKDIRAWMESQGFEILCIFDDHWFADVIFVRKNV